MAPSVPNDESYRFYKVDASFGMKMINSFYGMFCFLLLLVPVLFVTNMRVALDTTTPRGSTPRCDMQSGTV
jgi:hypothetical protein